MDYKKLDRSVLLPLTEDELELINQLRQLEGVKETRNVLRRALRLLAEKHNVQAGELFKDRQQGNRLPKENRLDQPKISEAA